MGMLDKLRGELIDIVEWIDDVGHALVWRFPRYHNQIKQGAQLIVRPGQMAVFVDRGKLADVFQPGQYELQTANLPVLSTLRGWMHGFDSPFKCEVYFVSTRQITDLKWGTPNPIPLRDPDFGPVRLRAFGTYTLKASEPAALLREVVGTDSVFDAEEIQAFIRSIINSTLATMLAEKPQSVLDLARDYQQLSETLRGRVVERIDDEYGLDIPQLYIVNVSLPEAVERAIDTRSSMSVIGDMERYQQYQFGQALGGAGAASGGGAASEGIGMGVGLAMAGRLMPQMAGGVATMPPPSSATMWHIAVNGQTRGPFALPQLAEAVARREVHAGTMVWTAGMTSWLPAAEVPQLGSLFSAAPPPLPT